MVIDAATRDSLELTRSAGGARAGSLLDAVDRAVTGAGRALAGRGYRRAADDRARDRGAARLVALASRRCASGASGCARR